MFTLMLAMQKSGTPTMVKHARAKVASDISALTSSTDAKCFQQFLPIRGTCIHSETLGIAKPRPPIK